MRPNLRSVPKFLQGGQGLPRPVLWAVAGLCLGAGVLGFTTGNRIADLTETEAITLYAHVYARETGGALTDCAAVPGPGAVWLTIRCARAGVSRIYRIDREGALIAPPAGPTT